MDPVSLAIAAAGLMAQRAAEAMAGEAGKSGWSGLQRLWELARHRLADDRDSGILDDVQRNPMNTEAVTALAAALQAQFDRDSGFRESMEGVVHEAQRRYSIVEITNNFFGNVRIGKMTNIGDVHGSVTF